MHSKFFKRKHIIQIQEEFSNQLRNSNPGVRVNTPVPGITIKLNYVLWVIASYWKSTLWWTLLFPFLRWHHLLQITVKSRSFRVFQITVPRSPFASGWGKEGVGGGYSFLGMCRWKMKTDPYIYQIWTQNWTHIFTGDQKFAPILRNVCKIYVKFAQIWEIFSKISRK